MVKHIIIWTLKDELSADEKKAAKLKIKTDLEALDGRIPGLISIKVYTDMLMTSNGDVMLESVHENESALGVYAVHPEHVKVKDYIGTVVKDRKCVDFKQD